MEIDRECILPVWVDDFDKKCKPFSLRPFNGCNYWTDNEKVGLFVNTTVSISTLTVSRYIIINTIIIGHIQIHTSEQ